MVIDKYEKIAKELSKFTFPHISSNIDSDEMYELKESVKHIQECADNYLRYLDGLMSPNKKRDS